MERASLLRLIRLESICADTRWGLLRKISRCCFITTSGRARVIMRYLCALHYIGWAATRARCTYPSSNYRGSSGWWTVLPGRRNLAQFVTRANFVARWSARLAFVLARVLARTLARSLARSSSRLTARTRTKNARIARRSNSTWNLTEIPRWNRTAVCIPAIPAITSLRHVVRPNGRAHSICNEGIAIRCCFDLTRWSLPSFFNIPTDARNSLRERKNRVIFYMMHYLWFSLLIVLMLYT